MPKNKEDYATKTAVIDKFYEDYDEPTPPPKTRPAPKAHVAPKAPKAPKQAAEPKKEHRLHIRITQDIKGYINEASHQRRQTEAQYIRSLIEADMAANAKPKSRGKGGK